jgi:hypothetical protein
MAGERVGRSGCARIEILDVGYRLRLHGGAVLVFL